jgi:hypothetical protein
MDMTQLDENRCATFHGYSYGGSAGDTQEFGDGEDVDELADDSLTDDLAVDLDDMEDDSSGEDE